MTSKCALIMKALGDDTRLEIFELLRNGSLCACKILDKFNITQPTLSHHMRILCDSGIVIANKEGKWIHYSINCALLNELTEFLSNTPCNRDTVCE
ncbi:MAG: metalloregulator ArsR/SmtB family transcription factor [Clostridia bacterium]|nr:metalloregulator ArsR/SmtB family transcription factor [Clostridia bacterium]